MPKSPTAVLVFSLPVFKNDLKLGPHKAKIPVAVLVFLFPASRNGLKLGPHKPFSPTRS